MNNETKGRGVTVPSFSSSLDATVLFLSFTFEYSHLIAFHAFLIFAQKGNSVRLTSLWHI
jgi:hypothetical protein